MIDGVLSQNVPLWALALAFEALVLVSIGAGVYIARLRYAAGGKKDSAGGTLAGASLGLLALILAFSFNMAASRYEARKASLLAEVNAIETTFLRAGLLPEPHRSQARTLIKRYANLRLQLIQGEKTVKQLVAQSELIQVQLWGQVEELRDTKLDTPVLVTLFINSLNEVFDLQTVRITVWAHQSIPGTIWMGLIGITVLTMLQVGFWAGHAASPNWFLLIVISLAFTGVVTLIADLDLVRESAHVSKQVGKQPVVDLVDRLNRS